MRVSSHSLGVTGQCDVVEFKRENQAVILTDMMEYGSRSRLSINGENLNRLMPIGCSFVVRPCV